MSEPAVPNLDAHLRAKVPASRRAAATTSSTLLRGAKASDPQAWERLCRVYAPVVYRWARKAGLQDQDAADIAQEVFCTVSARLPNFHRDRPGDTFRGWLWAITRHKLGDYLRQRKAQPQAAGGSDAYARLQGLIQKTLSDPQALGGPPRNAELAHRFVTVIRDEFEQRTWQAFWRAAIDGHSATQIALDLRMTRHAVRQAKYRVLRRLRLEVSEEH